MTGTGTTHDDFGQGPVVVLLHGYPFDRSMWREQTEVLRANGFRVIAPDLPGLGDKVPAQVSTMPEMARHVARLMDDLNVDQAIICGLSMGGYVAFDFAHLFPQRLRGLVLAGTRAPADNEQERKGREQQVEKMLAEGMAGIAEATLPKLLAPRTLTEKPDVVDRVRQMIVKSDPKGAAAAQRGMAARRDYTSDLSAIEVPTLIIVGRQDPIRPVTDAEFMHEQIRDSRLEIIEDAAHMTNMEQPETFNKALQKFLELIH
ncbi:MAG: alpha/beta hydrolase [Acidobacteriota bacterium]